MRGFHVFDEYSNLIAIVASEDRAKKIAEREDGYYRLDEKSSEKEIKEMKEENKYILKDISTDRTYYITLTPEQKRFWNWLVNNGVLCDVSLKEPVVDGFEKI